MTLELLFAKAVQGRIFLLMVLCGAALALGVQLAGFLRHRHPVPGMAADLFCALCLMLGLCLMLRYSGEGLRLYALLGLSIGAALYTACLSPAVTWTVRKCQALLKRCKFFRPHQQESPPPAQN